MRKIIIMSLVSILMLAACGGPDVGATRCQGADLERLELDGWHLFTVCSSQFGEECRQAGPDRAACQSTCDDGLCIGPARGR
jgi:hypothetical protein